MRVLLVFNPVSGRGAGARLADELHDALQHQGHEVATFQTSPDDFTDELTAGLDGIDVMCVIGGDGTVRSVAGAAAAVGTPFVHVPMGTENLLARGLRMRRSVDDVVRTVEHGQCVPIDLARCNGEPSVLMASIGLDAQIVHDVTAARGSSLSKWLYVKSMASRLMHHEPPVCTVTVDGQMVVEHTPGWLIIANAPDYGWRFDPAPQARVNDGQLDVVFLPARSGWGMLAWAARCRLGMHLRSADARSVRGRSVQVTCASPAPLQIDGDPPWGDGAVASMHMEIDANPLHVLVPPWAESCRPLMDHSAG